MKKRKLMVCLSLLLIASMLCGFGNSAELMLDTNVRRVYECHTADEIIGTFSRSKASGAEQYDEKYLRILGKVSDISKNHKKVNIESINAGYDTTIECSSSDDSIIYEIENTLSVGAIINVYGEFDVGITGSLNMSIDQIELSDEQDVAPFTYALKKDSYEFNRSQMYKRTLGNDKVNYYIPAGWADEDVERNIQEKKLGTIEGYQYNLNNLADYDDKEVIPECLFVTYFDNGLFLKDKGERGKTKEIEKAILNNMMPDEEKFVNKNVDTYYDTTYHYYQNVFTDNDSKSYRIEFVFEPVNKDGTIVFIYMYKDDNNVKHINDVMSVLRFTKIQ